MDVSADSMARHGRRSCGRGSTTAGARGGRLGHRRNRAGAGLGHGGGEGAGLRLGRGFERGEKARGARGEARSGRRPADADGERRARPGPGRGGAGTGDGAGTRGDGGLGGRRNGERRGGARPAVGGGWGSRGERREGGDGDRGRSRGGLPRTGVERPSEFAPGGWRRSMRKRSEAPGACVRCCVVGGLGFGVVGGWAGPLAGLAASPNFFFFFFQNCLGNINIVLDTKLISRII